ncbi:MAG TPA: methyltransferase domain-containing protein [Longimicrobiaceae bacterium]|nr:methyltransferase domain-containing protein [Longimicrobiaceae bacterium]
MTALPRARGAELMDEPDVDRGQLALSLADLRGVNRWLGGTRVVLHHLARMAARLPGKEMTVLDVATGSGDIPLHVARWARGRGLRARVTATDAHVGTLALAREHAGRDADVRVEHADALALPYADREFDFALCSTALHHFADEDAVQVLRELDRVARLGVVVNDLRRSRPALLGARLLAATVWRTHPVTRHDGPLSVRRSFTPRELLDLGRRAGMREAQVHAHQPFRLALVADRTRGPAGAA